MVKSCWHQGIVPAYLRLLSHVLPVAANYSFQQKNIGWLQEDRAEIIEILSECKQCSMHLGRVKRVQNRIELLLRDTQWVYSALYRVFPSLFEMEKMKSSRCLSQMSSKLLNSSEIDHQLSFQQNTTVTSHVLWSTQRSTQWQHDICTSLSYGSVDRLDGRGDNLPFVRL